MKKYNWFKNRSLNSFLGYSLKYKWQMLGVIILSSLTSVAGAAPAWLSKYLIDDVFVSRNKGMVYIVLSGFVVATIIKVISHYYAQISSSFLTETIRREIRLDVFKHLQALPLDFYKKNKLGDIMARLNGDSGALGTIGFVLFDMLKESVTVLVLLAKMFQVDPILATISITVLPAILGVVRSFTKKIRKAGRIRQDMFGEVASFMQESLSGIQVIKAFNRKNKIIKKYEEISLEELQKAYKSRKVSAKVNPINEIFTTLMVVMVFLYGYYKIERNLMTLGELVSFIAAVGLMQQPLKRLIDKNNTIQEALPSADRVIEMLDIPQEVEFYGYKMPIFDEVSSIEFKDLSFKYEDDGELILNKLNLKVKKGDIVALVGKSGSGKSTLVNLIPRFYETTSGSIDINGVDVKRYSLDEYRSHIGIVPQETFLFSGTIAENMAFGKDNVSKEEIEEAAKKANAYEFIVKLEKGFETEVGERGILLSGGQKQRIAIARALIQNPKIMILDEATSALDSESEKLVQMALDKLMEDRTTFVIAHRLSTVKNATKIVVMEDGEIKEVGTHNELLSKNGLYKKLYDIQYSGDSIAPEEDIMMREEIASQA